MKVTITEDEKKLILGINIVKKFIFFNHRLFSVVFYYL